MDEQVVVKFGHHMKLIGGSSRTAKHDRERMESAKMAARAAVKEIADRVSRRRRFS